MKTKLFFIVALLSFYLGYAQIGIGTLNPNPTSILDIESTNQGLLIPRMTLAQRDAIADPAPADGLQIYNTTNNTLDIYSNSSWKSFAYSPDSNLVYVYSLADLPTPNGSEISLDGSKMYVFSGAVDIGTNYILMNGAGLRGTDPQKDMVISAVSGAVLKSSGTNVYIKELAIVPASTSTQAYDFTGGPSNFCNIFSGSSVVDAMGPSSGVGTISGFNAITILQNYWNTANGVKIDGTVGKFTSGYNFIVGVSNGAGIELTSTLNAQDIDLSNNYFIYSGQNTVGLKINSGAQIDKGRLTTNLFRDVENPLEGIDSYSLGWNMSQNTNIPDSRAFSYIFFSGNTTETTIATQDVFVKIEGVTTVIRQQRFSSNVDNRIYYGGVDPITAKIFVVVSANAPKNNAGFSIAIAKNDSVPAVSPVATASSLSNDQSFQITLNSEIDLVSGDYIEVFIRNNTNTDNITVRELQFSVTD
ncbi:hypothetical protein G3567_02655 [Psychroflexus sp. YR1-1]|uniref:Uncharacterized protein n=1 Tax=Psychroflexus aurantiacus TaxID=2709310 RepID=A0A6B3R1V9_9FLAO|nr:hypothetical protein [Psychroflexus aurantiacus]NEV93047.1 hypothetical protein [Psychroflexus aurantiacus]